MNFALSQRGPGRHPVGLSVVVALHAVLAAVLLVANTIPRPGHPEAAALLLPENPAKPPPPPRELPRPQESVPRALLLPVPEIRPEQRAPEEPAPLLATPGPLPVSPHEAGTGTQPSSMPARSAARAARIDAGAAACRPAYPPAAQRAGATGTTRIRFTIAADGAITRAEILRSSGPTHEHRLLDRAAAEALQHCPIAVGLDESGRPVGTSTEVEYSWVLD